MVIILVASKVLNPTVLNPALGLDNVIYYARHAGGGLPLQEPSHGLPWQPQQIMASLDTQEALDLSN